MSARKRRRRSYTPGDQIAAAHHVIDTGRSIILDVFYREIVGWQVTNHMRETLAGGALTMALAAEYRAGEVVTGLVHHSDRGV